MNTVAQLPFTQTHVLDVAPALRLLQSRGKVHRVRTPEGVPAWLVTGHAEVQQLLDDDRLSRSDPGGRDGGTALLNKLLGPLADDHPRLRSLLEPQFTPERLEPLRAIVEKLTEQHLDELATRTPPVDLRPALAMSLPILVLCEWLGVPAEDKDRFSAWTQDAAGVQDPERSQRGLAELFGYCRQLVAAKRQDPGDDVISRLIATAGIGDTEVVALTALLLFGGYETTVARIGTGVLLLLTNPDQWAAVRADPALMPATVDELLRRSMPNPHNGGMPRFALTGFEIDGAAIRAGDLVLLNIIAANHDETAFPDPDRLDVTRPTAGSLAFGYGRHSCVGAPLARMVLRVTLSRLITRFPDLCLAVGVDELKLRHETLVGGLVELPVTWGPR